MFPLQRHENYICLGKINQFINNCTLLFVTDLRCLLEHINLQFLSIIYAIYFEHKRLLAYNDAVNWN